MIRLIEKMFGIYTPCPATDEHGWLYDGPSFDVSDTERFRVRKKFDRIRKYEKK